MKKNEITWASAFLSHSSCDKELVTAVAKELGQRGIIPWLDVQELLSGQSMTQALEEAVQNQTAFLFFLSQEAIQSAWAGEELEAAIEMEGKIGQNHIIPVYLGDPLTLVTAHEILKTRWRHPDGDRVNRLGIKAAPGNTQDNAVRIADETAKRIYHLLGLSKKKEVVVCLDQRGNGQRRGLPKGIPDNIKGLDQPALTFRPNLAEKSQNQILAGEAWDCFSRNILWALKTGIGDNRGPDRRKIRILGNAQLSLAFLLGWYFDRNTNCDLFCYSLGQDATNQGQDRTKPLEGKNDDIPVSHPRLPPVPVDYQGPGLALFLMMAHTLDPALSHWETTANRMPGIWVSHERFAASQDIMAYIGDVVALLLKMKTTHHIRTLYLYTGLPFHVLPLLACNLLHVMDQVIFMEYRKDLQEETPGMEDMYTPLDIRR